MAFEIIPAIDLRNGRCVRLYQGDYARESTFSEHPVEVAKHWESLGAPRLHIVDLDGALAGEPQNSAVIQDIVLSVAIPVQVGGGIRGLSAAQRLLASGVDRIILGTAAVRDQAFVKEVARHFGDRIIVGIDARDGYVAVSGWQEASHLLATDLVQQVAEWGIKRIIYTDISRDGTLTRPNFKAIKGVVENTKLSIVASGGVSTVEHLRKLKEIGAEGAIVGMALYTKTLDLKEALTAFETVV